MPNPEALKLPDSLLVRYFRADETDHIRAVHAAAAAPQLTVTLQLPAGPRTDCWRDLGGGLGYVPDLPAD